MGALLAVQLQSSCTIVDITDFVSECMIRLGGVIIPLSSVLGLLFGKNHNNVLSFCLFKYLLSLQAKLH